MKKYILTPFKEFQDRRPINTIRSTSVHLPTAQADSGEIDTTAETHSSETSEASRSLQRPIDSTPKPSPEEPVTPSLSGEGPVQQPTPCKRGADIASKAENIEKKKKKEKKQKREPKPRSARDSPQTPRTEPVSKDTPELSVKAKAIHQHGQLEGAGNTKGAKFWLRP